MNFNGTFEGLGNTISNLTISNAAQSGAENIGLFSQVNGTVADLILKNVNVSITNSGGAFVDLGALTGLTYGTINNVSVTGSVFLDDQLGDGEVGVLAGEKRRHDSPIALGRLGSRHRSLRDRRFSW